MRIFITGLCLQGNKGGPALALSLMEVLRREIPDAEFTLSVPAGAEWPHEKEAADRYGVPVVPSFGLPDVLPPFCFKQFPERLRRFFRWAKTLRRSQAIVDMQAITYMGPPIGPGDLKTLLCTQRFHVYVLSRVLFRPMLAWTQSYGPFTTRWVRWAAKSDLKRQPVIFCRGDDCLAGVEELLPKKEARSFPDVAIELPYKTEEGASYLGDLLQTREDEKIVTISPSAVVYSRSERHVEEMAEVCTWLAGRGYRVCLVPHTLRVGRPDPKICDLAVCNLVAEGCSEEARPAVVSDDLSPMELKGIISQAWIHVGARYHSVVAALSSGVPCLSLSWHGKYRDIMRKYGSEEFVYDGVSGETDQFKQLFDRLDKDHEDIAATLAERHSTVADEVKENARMMAGLLKERTKS